MGVLESDPRGVGRSSLVLAARDVPPLESISIGFNIPRERGIKAACGLLCPSASLTRGRMKLPPPDDKRDGPWPEELDGPEGGANFFTGEAVNEVSIDEFKNSELPSEANCELEDELEDSSVSFKRYLLLAALSSMRVSYKARVVIFKVALEENLLGSRGVLNILEPAGLGGSVLESLWKRAGSCAAATCTGIGRAELLTDQIGGRAVP